MADRIPLIVNPTASQIQELPSGDSLNGIANITATGTVQAEQLTSTDDATITGEITVSGQPNCLLTVPVNYTANSSTNSKPISFTNTTTNVNCTTSLSPIATQNSGITSISVPSAGTYLVSASISGVNNMGGSDNQNTDQVRFALSKSGISSFPNSLTYPTCVFGRENSSEFNVNFTLPLQLSASDTLSVHFSHIDGSQASIEEGYFSVTKLH
mgnify:CR=1 FL=1